VIAQVGEALAHGVKLGAECENTCAVGCVAQVISAGNVVHAHLKRAMGALKRVHPHIGRDHQGDSANQHGQSDLHIHARV